MDKTKLEQIKRNIARQKLLREQRERRAAKPVQERRASRLIQERRAVRPVQERRAARPVVEARPNFAAKRPMTLNERVSQKINTVPAELRNTYNILAENMINSVKAINEVTQAGNVAVGKVMTYFDIFFGYFPQLITPLIASTQPIKTANATVFFYEALAGSDKGLVQKGDLLQSPFEFGSEPHYTSDFVEMGVIEGTDAFTKELPLWAPLAAEKIVVEGAILEWTSDTEFTATFEGMDAELEGTITVSGDTIKVETTAATGADAEDINATIGYVYDNVYAPTQVPALLGNLKDVQITAQTRTVKTNFSVQAAFGFEAQFGKKLGDQLAESAMYELRREIDLEAISKVFTTAPVLITWNKNPKDANGLFEIHKRSFKDAVVRASNEILLKSKRAAGNILLVGIDAKSVVETLPEFQPDTSNKHVGVIGKLMGMKVISSPDLLPEDFAVIYKSEKDDFDAGLIFAPYIPVMATDEVTLDDLQTRKAYLTSYGMKVINPNFFVKGKIIDSETADHIIVINK
jgi:hypothetical protein